MKSPRLFEVPPKRQKGVMWRVWQQDEFKLFRLTPALENAGYIVPAEILLREGYAQKRVRQVIEERGQ